MATEKLLIDVKAFREYWNKNYRNQYANENFLVALANFPTVDAVPVVHGMWITDEKGVTYCGRCKVIDDFASVHNYCPNCGARMDGEGQ